MTQLTADQIRAAIENRIDAMSGVCNAGYRDHADGLLRGLLWALTGVDPGTYVTTDMRNVLNLAGIPFTEGTDGLLHYARRAAGATR